MMGKHNGNTSNDEVPNNTINIEIFWIYDKINIARFDPNLFYRVGINVY